MTETNNIPERKKHLRNPKKPSLQKKVKFTSEMDLWNLEDDDQPLQLETSRIDPQRHTHLPPVPSAEDEQENIQETTDVGDGEVIQEPNSIRSEKDTPIISARARYGERKQEVHAPLVESRIIESNDLWEDLDASEADTTAETEQVSLNSDETTSIENEDAVDFDVNRTAHAADDDNQIIGSILEQPSTKYKNHADIGTPYAAAEPLTTQSSEPDQLPTPEKPLKTSFFASFTLMEKVASFIFVVLVVSMSGGILVWFKNNVKRQDDPYAMPSFPVKGTHAIVKNIESYWREPIKSGSNADPVQSKVISIPELRIRLAQDTPQNGVLRVKFLDSDKKTIGDTMTKSLNSGTFQTDFEAKFACTAGFSSSEQIDTYLATTGKPWRVEVYEAAKADAPPYEFTLLFSAPISKTQK